MMVQELNLGEITFNRYHKEYKVTFNTLNDFLRYSNTEVTFIAQSLHIPTKSEDRSLDPVPSHVRL